MRARTLVATFLVLAPAALSAQRLPLPRIRVPLGRQGPAEPDPLPPQPYPVAAQLAYTRSHLSVESYPMVSFFSVPGFAGPGRASSWTSIGVGSHADYRLARFMSATMDLTSSLLGGPARTQTAEVGTRFHEPLGESRWYPYADVRLAYVASYLNSGSVGDVFVDPATQAYYGGYSHGFGGIVGTGLEYRLTRTISLISGASLLRGKLTQHDPATFDRHFTMTSLRYTLGVRFNPIHLLSDSRPEARATKAR
jgi:hypothetical protein